MFIPDFGSRVKKIPGSASKNLSNLTHKLFLSSRLYDLGCSSRIQIPDLDPQHWKPAQVARCYAGQRSRSFYRICTMAHSLESRIGEGLFTVSNVYATGLTTLYHFVFPWRFIVGIIVGKNKMKINTSSRYELTWQSGGGMTRTETRVRRKKCSFEVGFWLAENSTWQSGERMMRTESRVRNTGSHMGWSCESIKKTCYLEEGFWLAENSTWQSGKRMMRTEPRSRNSGKKEPIQKVSTWRILIG